MSVHQATLKALNEMGIEAPLARAAAQRFENVDAAVNWCFGEGANWTPDQDGPRLNRPIPPTPTNPSPAEISVPGTTVEHREVVPTQSDSPSSNTVDPRSPPLPPRARPLPSPGRQSPKPLGDKNPFRNSLRLETNNPFAQQSAGAPALKLGDEDEELQRAILMSQEPALDVERSATELEEEEKRDRTARMVRTSGPPPSPTLQAANPHSQLPVIGPTQQSSPYINNTTSSTTTGDWQTPFADHQSSAFPQRSKEDEELDKAIADSLMTASFHSAASAPPDESTPQEPRLASKPLVLYSPTGQTASANLLQGLLAIPQFRKVIANVLEPSESSTDLDAIRSIVDKTDDVTKSFMNVDAVVRNLKGTTPGRELPPTGPARHLAERLDGMLLPLLYARRESLLGRQDPLDLPLAQELFGCEISNIPSNPKFVEFTRDHSPYDTHHHLARALWTEDSNASILVLPDILTMYLGWQPGYRKELWKLENELVMDRYMAENAGWAAKARAMQGLAEGNCKRLQEKINGLTNHDGNDVALTLTNTIKHYEAFPGKDDIETEHRSEIKAKLLRIQERLQEKIEALKSELETEEDNANGAHFDTDDPKLRQYVYRLRAVLFHDGLTTGTGHLYMYVLGDDDQWWKIVEHEASPVDWSDVATDEKGKFMEGGPYCLLYERATPRPIPEVIPQQTVAVPQDQNMSSSDATVDGILPIHASASEPAVEQSNANVTQTDDLLIDQPASNRPLPSIDLLGVEEHTVLPPKPRSTEPRPLPKPPVQTEQRGDPASGRPDEDVSMS